MHPNLASEENANKINQRFKELTSEVLELQKEIKFLKGTVGNMQNLIQKQTQMIQNVWVNKNGTGATEK